MQGVGRVSAFSEVARGEIRPSGLDATATCVRRRQISVGRKTGFSNEAQTPVRWPLEVVSSPSPEVCQKRPDGAYRKWSSVFPPFLSLCFYGHEQKLSGPPLRDPCWPCSWLLCDVRMTHPTVFECEGHGLGGNVKRFWTWAGNGARLELSPQQEAAGGV